MTKSYIKNPKTGEKVLFGCRHYSKHVSVSKTDLLRQLYVLPH